MSLRKPMRVEPTDGVAYSVLGDRYVIKVSGEDTSGAYALFEFFVPPGHGSAPHVHRREEEGFQILKGELSFFIGPERTRIVAGPGQFVQAPRDVPHFFRNEGVVPVLANVIVAPAGLERFFAEVGTQLPTVYSSPLPFTAEQLQRVNETAPKYGLEMLGPPPWLAPGGTH